MKIELIENLIAWLERQNAEWRDTLCFQILYMAPGADTKNGGLDKSRFEQLGEYMRHSQNQSEGFGKLLYLLGALDYNMNDWDDVDAHIDNQLDLKSMIITADNEGDDAPDLKKLFKSGNQRFEIRKQIKADWQNYKANHFTMEIIQEAHRQSLLNR